MMQLFWNTLFLCAFWSASTCRGVAGQGHILLEPEVGTSQISISETESDGNNNVRRVLTHEDSICPPENTDCNRFGLVRQTPNVAVTPLAMVGCRGGYEDENEDEEIEVYSTPQVHARCFVLEKEGCSGNRVIDSVTFAVEVASQDISVNINIYKDCGCLSGAPGTGQAQLIATKTTTVGPGDDGGLVTVAINSGVVIAQYEAIRVEVEQLVDGRNEEFDEENPWNFFPGATTSSFVGFDTYWKAPACRFNSFVSLASIGFPAANLILDLNTSPVGFDPSPLPCCTESFCHDEVEVCSAGLEQCVLTPECKDPPLDSCDFYAECLDALFDCGEDGYPLKFGERMCNIYLENDNRGGLLAFSPGGTAWSRDVRKCLQDVLVPVLEGRDCFNCQIVEDYAFASHVPCYLNTGFCTLPEALDYAKWLFLTRSALSFDAATKIINQGAGILGGCGRQGLAAIEATFTENLADLLDRFNGIQEDLQNYLIDEIFQPLLPQGPVIVPTIFIYNLLPGSTKVVLATFGDGINGPQELADDIMAGLPSSNGGSLSLTFESARSCIDTGCDDILGVDFDTLGSTPTTTSSTSSTTVAMATSTSEATTMTTTTSTEITSTSTTAATTSTPITTELTTPTTTTTSTTSSTEPAGPSTTTTEATSTSEATTEASTTTLSTTTDTRSTTQATTAIQATTTNAITMATTDENGESGGGGDPHFKRWHQREHSTFHGECDLVLVHSDCFHNNAGFDLHVRTTIHSFYSFIESAAVRVGNTILEVERDGFFVDQEPCTYNDLPKSFGLDEMYTLSAIKKTQKVTMLQLNLHLDSSIIFKFYKHYLTISVSGNRADFQDSVGLLGEYGTGDMFDRAGSKISSFEDLAFHWQVNPNYGDSQLFHEARSPQMPYERCRMPTASRPARRLLRGNETLYREAQDACDFLRDDSKDFHLCVDDIMMTGDVGLAEAW